MFIRLIENTLELIVTFHEQNTNGSTNKIHWSCQHPSDGLVNIVTGKLVSHPSINVYNAVSIGQTEMESFQKTWPKYLNNTIPRHINTMYLFRKHLMMDTDKVFDTETIYTRAISMEGRSCSIDTDSLLAHELAPYPSLMFDADGQMLEAKSKKCPES
jgi:hypothetical protein